MMVYYATLIYLLSGGRTGAVESDIRRFLRRPYSDRTADHNTGCLKKPEHYITYAKYPISVNIAIIKVYS